MPPARTSIWLHDSNVTASGKAGAVQAQKVREIFGSDQPNGSQIRALQKACEISGIKTPREKSGSILPRNTTSAHEHSDQPNGSQIQASQKVREISGSDQPNGSQSRALQKACEISGIKTPREKSGSKRLVSYPISGPNVRRSLIQSVRQSFARRILWEPARKEKRRQLLESAAFFSGCGGRIRTYDLQVMSRKCIPSAESRL